MVVLEEYEMIQYKSILVPIDGSEHSKKAVEHAITIATINNAQVILLHVANIVSAISNFDQTPITGGYVSEQLAKEMEDTGREILNEVMKTIPENINAQEVFEVGSPGPAIIAVAKKFDVDLIVMGSRGLGLLKGIFMGSVSSYVASHETCPVLIIK